MSKTIKEVYDDDPTNRNDPTLDGYIPGDDGANTPVAYNIDQLAGAIGHRLGPVVQNDFIVTIGENTLTANISPITNTYTHWIITVDDDVEPIYPIGFTAGSLQLTKDVSAWGTSETWRLWLYNFSTQTLLPEITDPNGISGVTVTPNPTASPAPIEDLVVAAGANAETQITYTFSATTIIDGVTIRYDIVDTQSDGVTVRQVLSSDVSAPASGVTISGLTPGQTYAVKVRTYPATDLSRSSVSNLQTITTDVTTISIDTLTIDDLSTAGSPFNANISAVSFTGADEWIYQVNDSTPPSILDSGWTAIPSVSDDVTAPGFGSHIIYAWARLSTDTSNISVVKTDTFDVTDSESGTAIFAFTSSMISYDEEGALTVDIPISRTNDTSGIMTVEVASSDSTTGSVAIPGQNYQSVNKTVTFEDAEATHNVSVNLLWDNLGHINGSPNERQFVLTLDNPSAGDVGVQDTVTIRILGTNGYWSTGDIDTNNPPVNLTQNSQFTWSGTGSESTTFTQINANGGNHGITIANGASNKTLENCIVENSGQSAISGQRCSNLKIRNCVFRDYNNSLAQYNNAAMYFGGGSTPSSTGIDIYSNYAIANGRGWAFIYSGALTLNLSWNYHKDTMGENGIIAQSIHHSGNHLMQQWGCSGGTWDCRGNVNNVPVILANSFDVINIGDGGVTSEGNRAWCQWNTLHGASRASDSGGGIIANDGSGSSNGYITASQNIIVETGNFAVALSGGRDITFTDNDCYSPEGSQHANQNGQGVVVWRDVDTGPGNLFNGEVSTNNVLWYQSGSTSPSYKWMPSTGADSQSPNHGATSQVNPTGWTTQVEMTIWDNGGGDTLVKQRKAILTQPAYGDGIFIYFADYNCTPGDGVLYWDYSESTLSFASYGDTTGTPVTISTGATGTWDAWYDIKSNDNTGIRVSIYPDDLPALDTAYVVKVTTHNLQDVHIYPGTLGYWDGVDRISTDIDGVAPSVPVITSVTSSGGDTLILAWPDSSDNGSDVGGYNIYRDDVLIASPTSSDYSDSDATLVISQSYSYEISSFDGSTPPVYSARSQPMSGTLTATATNAVVNGDFDSAIGAEWTTIDSTAVVTTGVCKITTTSATSGRIYQATTTLSPSTSYDIDLRMLGGYNKPSTGYRKLTLMIQDATSSTPGVGWSVGSDDILYSWHGLTNDNDWFEWSNTFTSPGGTGEVNVILAVETGDNATWVEVDYIRIT